MINYIEDMMKTAGVNTKTVCAELKKEGFYCGTCPIINPTSCDKVIYPDFTAEKQLEIIKLLNDTSDFHCAHNNLSSLTEEGAIEVYNEDFSQALAQLTIELMNAGELDKSKVKEILEG